MNVDLSEEWRSAVASICFWMADNYTVWQPFALLAAVGLLLFSFSALASLWEGLS